MDEMYHVESFALMSVISKCFGGELLLHLLSNASSREVLKASLPPRV